jgi:hypothetical protein
MLKPAERTRRRGEFVMPCTKEAHGDLNSWRMERATGGVWSWTEPELHYASMRKSKWIGRRCGVDCYLDLPVFAK